MAWLNVSDELVPCTLVACRCNILIAIFKMEKVVDVF